MAEGTTFEVDQIFKINLPGASVPFAFEMKILHYGQNGLFPLNIAPWSFAMRFLIGNDFFTGFCISDKFYELSQGDTGTRGIILYLKQLKMDK